MNNKKNDNDSSAAETSAAETKSVNAPVARVQKRPPGGYSKLWWLTGACLILAMALFGGRYLARGPVIQIEFQDGYGLKIGDTLRYRGVDIGEVTDVKLSDDLDLVTAIVQLDPDSQSVAVEGSQFWIQRARLRIGQVSGLDTVLGAKYLGVAPGPADAPAKSQFVGVETPLGMTQGGWISVSIQFADGNGIQVGDPIRYRGIDVGEVVGVDLDPSMDSVSVEAHLIGQAMKFAQNDAQFWIERPRLDLTEVRGLDTVVAGRYIAVEFSGPLTESTRTRFVGLDQPPQRAWQAGSLEVELECRNRKGLTVGAPVMYRGLEVGEVTNVRLADDSASLLVTCVVQPESAMLVREDTRWWSNSGFQMEAGLSGFGLEVPSLSALLRGGVSFATPTQPGPPAATGKRFELKEQPEEEWIRWQPRLSANLQAKSTGGSSIPNTNGGSDAIAGRVQPIRVAAKWKAGITGLYRQKSIDGWAVVVQSDTNTDVSTPRLVVTKVFWDRVSVDSDAVSFEFAGQRIDLKELQAEVATNLVWLQLPSQQEGLPAAVSPREDDSPVDLVQIVNPTLASDIAIEANRLTKIATGWQLDKTIAIDAGQEGSAVVDRDGQLVGVLTKIEGNWQIATLGLK